MYALRAARTRPAPLALAFAAAGMAACAPAADSPATDPPAADSTGGAVDMAAVADALMERMDLQPGERVLLVGRWGGRWDAIAPLLRERVEAAGAVHLGAVDVRGAAFPGEEPTDFAAALGAGAAAWPELLRGVDVAVKLPGAVPDPTAPADLYRAIQGVLDGGGARTVHFHWAGATSFEMEELPVGARVDEAYQRAVLETDYAALEQALAEFEAALRSGPARVTTPAGTDISFEVGDRPVTRQDGDASAARAASARNLIDREVEIPAGAVRVSPVLASVNGTIAFPPGAWAGERVEGVAMRFENGRAVDIQGGAEAVERVRAELDAGGEGSRSFRELAVGFNPLLAIREEEEWIPYYGYGAGVVRLSLGDNTELGGSVGGGYVRWNFFADATVTVNGEAWVRDGRLVR